MTEAMAKEYEKIEERKLRSENKVKINGKKLLCSVNHLCIYANFSIEI